MKRGITFITVLFAVCLLCLGEASAAALPGPVLSVNASRITVTISWTEVERADGYLFYYAPYPSAHPIGQLDVGPQTGPFVLELWPEAAFYIAVQAYGAEGPGEYSNIESFSLPLMPLHRDDVAPDCLEGCYTTCTGQGRGLTECIIECEYACGTRAYVIIEKTYSDARIDARAKIYMLLAPTGVEDAFTVDFAELHSLTIRVDHCTHSLGEFFPPTGGVFRVFADREHGTLTNSVIPPVGVTAVICCDGFCSVWGGLSMVERPIIQASEGQHSENVSPWIIGEFWEVNLGICRLTYAWTLYTPE